MLCPGAAAAGQREAGQPEPAVLHERHQRGHARASCRRVGAASFRSCAADGSGERRWCPLSPSESFSCCGLRALRAPAEHVSSSCRPSAAAMTGWAFPGPLLTVRVGVCRLPAPAGAQLGAGLCRQPDQLPGHKADERSDAAGAGQRQGCAPPLSLQRRAPWALRPTSLRAADAPDCRPGQHMCSHSERWWMCRCAGGCCVGCAIQKSGVPHRLRGLRAHSRRGGLLLSGARPCLRACHCTSQRAADWARARCRQSTSRGSSSCCRTSRAG